MIKNLRKLRLKKGISQEKLANAIGGISQQSINKYENHNVEPDIYLLRKMADYFAVAVDYLFGHSDIARRIEAVQHFDLNADEAKRIEKYRLLSVSERDSIHLVMDNYLNNTK